MSGQHHTVRLFPDPVLRKKAALIERFDASLKDIVRHMADTMKYQPLGIGIAAPQVGISKRVVIVDVSKRDPGRKRLIMVNPVIVEMSQERASREGCMSLPDYTGYLKRWERMRVSWQDESGNFHETISEGIEAVCIQHEIDHLNGILFIDHVASLKRDMIPRPVKGRTFKQ